MIDSITVEVIRAKLESIADDGARSVVRTAISPIVTESQDCSCAIYNADGSLICGGGHVESHFHSGGNGVRAILASHHREISPGDIFLVNDPYAGGGLHAQDVFIHQPVFDSGDLVAWIGSSAHMMDMGGGLPGSFVPAATECYQEAIRFPPVRLYRDGIEQKDVWAIVRNNIRNANLIEMDMRSLISGSNIVRKGLQDLITEYGIKIFRAAVAELANLSEAEFRRRIGWLEPGTYHAASWAEWTEDDYYVPCTLTVERDCLVFDYSAASDQTLHYYNSKAYVIESLLAVSLAAVLAPDVPFNNGIFRTFTVRCREGSILDARPPAPIGAPHLEVGSLAAEIGVHALNLAILASKTSEASSRLTAPPTFSGLAPQGWSGLGYDGHMEGWFMMDGGAMGPGAGHDRDADDFGSHQVAKGVSFEFVDTETTEHWYPVRILHRRVRPGSFGAGKYRAGHGVEIAYSVARDQPISGLFMGIRERFPNVGMAGGYPGALNEFEIRTEPGETRRVYAHQQGVPLRPKETFIARLSNGGGWGDPLDRDPELVAFDVETSRLSSLDAEQTYGVVVGDPFETERLRRELLAARLVRATRPAAVSTVKLDALSQGMTSPLYPGIVALDDLAVSTRSGAILAKSPVDWTEGCAVIHNFLPSHPSIDIIAYLDPVTGHTLVVDVVRVDTPRAFWSRPAFWVERHNRIAAE